MLRNATLGDLRVDEGRVWRCSHDDENPENPSQDCLNLKSYSWKVQVVKTLHVMFWLSCMKLQHVTLWYRWLYLKILNLKLGFLGQHSLANHQGLTSLASCLYTASKRMMYCPSLFLLRGGQHFLDVGDTWTWGKGEGGSFSFHDDSLAKETTSTRVL